MMMIMMMMELFRKGHFAVVDREAEGREGFLVRNILHIGRNDVAGTHDRVNHTAGHDLLPKNARHY
jgi:hypothetical protein